MASWARGGRGQLPSDLTSSEEQREVGKVNRSTARGKQGGANELSEVHEEGVGRGRVNLWLTEGALGVVATTETR
eukprot:scaffold2639_cov361-Pavlova_lutheri.AAC.11